MVNKACRTDQEYNHTIQRFGYPYKSCVAETSVELCADWCACNCSHNKHRKITDNQVKCLRTANSVAEVKQIDKELPKLSHIRKVKNSPTYYYDKHSIYVLDKRRHFIKELFEHKLFKNK